MAAAETNWLSLSSKLIGVLVIYYEKYPYFLSPSQNRPPLFYKSISKLMMGQTTTVQKHLGRAVFDDLSFSFLITVFPRSAYPP